MGVLPEDFILKPVRHSELLDWLERKLELVWLSSAPMASASPARQHAQLPPRSELLDLQALVQLGYPSGILNKIDSLDTEHPDCRAFTAPLAALTRKYQLEAVLTHLQKVLDDPETR